jgi:hypothetical protein
MIVQSERQSVFLLILRLWHLVQFDILQEV